MPSPPPLQYSRYYHIYNRGNNRENIFIEERNYSYFLKLYASHVEAVADTYAYCLLRNHFHFLVRIKTEEETLRVFETLRVSSSPRSPSQRFSNLFNAYTKTINKTYGRTGSLFEHPFGRVEVTTDAHFTVLIAYIHQNPQKHDFVKDFRDWPYSSYHAMLSTKQTRLQRDEVLAWFGGLEQFDRFHQREAETGKIAPLILGDFV